MSSAQYYETQAWEFLEKGDRKKAVEVMRYGASRSLGRGRADRMRDYADAIEETPKEIGTKDLIEKWLRQEIDPDNKEDF